MLYSDFPAKKSHRKSNGNQSVAKKEKGIVCVSPWYTKQCGLASWDQSLPSCVTFGKSYNLSLPQISCLQNGTHRFFSG